MLAAVLREFDRPWRLEQLPDPEPGPGQVVLRVEASGFCGTDVHVHHGLMDVQAPLVPGHEPVGVVVAVGDGVAWPRLGDRVGVTWTQRGCGACERCARGREVHCPQAQTWMDLGGGHAELMLAWAAGCTAVPDGLDPTLAAPLFCAGHTVMSALRRGGLQPGERVAVLGLGGLGHLAIQCAKALGHEVVALTSSEQKAADARALGADDAVEVGWHAGRALDDAGGADVVIATSNSAAQTCQVVSGLRPEGRLVVAGFVDGPLLLDPYDLLADQLSVLGVVLDRREDLEQVLDLAASGAVRPVVEVHPLASHQLVLDRVARGAVRHRAVLVNG